MKKILLIVTLLAFSLSLTAAMAAPANKTEGSGIEWLTNMDEALKRASAENKPILLDFFNPN